MATLRTTRNNLPYPDQNEPPSVPRDLEALAEAVESLLVETLMPTGTVMGYVGAVAPTGWQFCDGTDCGSEDLKLALGSQKVPDLRGSFVRGTDLAGIGQTGGADIVALTAANQPNHTHPVSGSDGQVTNHGHTASHAGVAFGAVGHAHVMGDGSNFAFGNRGPNSGSPAPGQRVIGGGNMGPAGSWVESMSDGWTGYLPAGPNAYTPPAPTAAAHAHGTAAFDAGAPAAAEADHGHNFAINPAGSGQSFSNVPPYYAVNFIIKK